MTESSLAASIFGGGEKSEAAQSSLSNIFDASITLPEQPNKLNFTESTDDRSKRERKEEKRRKRKAREAGESENQDGGEAKTTKDESGGDGADVTPTAEEEERTIFVGNLPGDTTRKSLAAIFRSCGDIKSTRIRSIATAGVKVAPEQKGNQNLVKKVSANTNKLLENSKNSSQGYVVFEKIESVVKAIALNNTPAPNSNGLLLRVDRAKPTIDSSRSVFVGGLPYKADELSVREHFNFGCGFESDVIENVRIVRDPSTLQCKGFGYVLLKDKSYVPYALGMHESEFKKRKIRVLVCGKRYKGKKGVSNEEEPSNAEKRLLKKAKLTKGPNKSILMGGKEKKKRGVKKTGPMRSGNTGISKRAASERKVDKRVKKLEKRAQKGMGKAKK